MAKNKVVKEYDELLDLDFSDDMGHNDEAIAGMMNGMIAASQHQQVMAIELTKLVVGKNSADSMSEENIFSVFKRASKMVAENFPLKEIWEKFS